MRFVDPGFDGYCEYRSPFFCVHEGIATYELLGHVGVPDMVEIGGYIVELHDDTVAASVQALVVQGLVDVAYKLGM